MAVADVEGISLVVVDDVDDVGSGGGDVLGGSGGGGGGGSRSATKRHNLCRQINTSSIRGVIWWELQEEGSLDSHTLEIILNNSEKRQMAGYLFNNNRVVGLLVLIQYCFTIFNRRYS